MYSKIIDNYLKIYKINDLFYKKELLSNTKFNYTIIETLQLINKIINSINYDIQHYGLTKHLTKHSIIVFVALEDINIKVNNKPILLNKNDIIATHKQNKLNSFITHVNPNSDTFNSGILFFFSEKDIKVILVKCNTMKQQNQKTLKQHHIFQEIQCLTYKEAFLDSDATDYDIDSISLIDDNNDNYDFYYINMDKDLNRKKVIEKQFVNNSLKRVKAVEHNKGYIGLLLSNYIILKHFIERSSISKCPVILEDDCFLLDTLPVFKTRWNSYKNVLKNTMGQWNYFSGGCIYIRPTRIVCEDPCIVECTFGTCTQFIVHSENSAKEVINHMENKQNVFKGIDRFLTEKFDTFWVPYPFLCIQKSENTNICNHMCKDDYLNVLQKEFSNSQRVLEKFVKTHTKNKRLPISKTSELRETYNKNTTNTKHLFKMFN